MKWETSINHYENLTTQIKHAAGILSQLYSGFEITPVFSHDKPKNKGLHKYWSFGNMIIMKAEEVQGLDFIKAAEVLLGDDYVIKPFGANYLVGYVGELNILIEFYQ